MNGVQPNTPSNVSDHGRRAGEENVFIHPIRFLTGSACFVVVLMRGRLMIGGGSSARGRRSVQWTGGN